MYGLKKNQIIVTALVIMIVIAGYLNYNDKTQKEDSQFVFNEGVNKEFALDDGALVPNDQSGQPTIKQTAKQNDTKSQKKDEEKKSGSKTKDSEVAKTSESKDDPGTAVFVQSNAVVSEYFVEQKLTREKVNAQTKEEMLEVMNNKNTPQKQKAEAAEKIMGLRDRVKKESEAEALIEAKGFKEVFVRIADNAVDVIVDKSAISEAEIAQIQNIITRVTNKPAKEITISPFKTNSK